MIVLFGGTGTLGHALAEIVSKEGYGCVVVSRCELRQKEMAAKYPLLHYVIGDITNMDWAEHLPAKPTHVFNLAAMKHVDVAEGSVNRCIDINYNGTVNTYRWARNCGAISYSFSSTDKAVLPINAYGMSKAIAEKYLYERARSEMDPVITSIFRWANVIGSRGSVFHFFAKTIKSEGKVYITHPEMTRFWIHIRDVAQFMWDRRCQMTLEKPHIPKMKATSVVRMAKEVARQLGCNDLQIEYTGIRPGEKIHECLYTSHEYCLTSNTCEQFSNEELAQLVSEVLNDSATR